MKGNSRSLTRKFCLDGSIQGLKYFYLFPDKYSRCFWLLCVLVIVHFAMWLTWLLYRRFEANPTRITIENQFEPVAPLPYPAITLCSPNQMTISSVRHFDRTLVNGNRSVEVTIALRQLLGFYHFIATNLEELIELQHLFELNRYTVPEVMVELAQNCEQFLRMCVFRRRLYPRCRGLFTPVLTKQGLCCIFNSGYSYRKNRRNEREQHFQPHLVGWTSIADGLSVVADYEPDDAVDNTIHYAGATRIMFTDWTEFPADDESLLLASNTESFHFIHATATYCSSEVQELPPQSRKCLMDNERHLPFFRSYRNSDCDLLCLVHAVEKRCQCLLFYLPNIRQQQTCGPSSIRCIADTKLNLNEYMESEQCECPRDCDSRHYHVDTSVGNLAALPYMYRPQFSGGIEINASTSIMHFVFQTTIYKKQKQETVMSLTTLVSNLGGVFGLCLGCSVISVLELWFYYYCGAKNCARAHINKRRRHRKPVRLYYE